MVQALKAKMKDQKGFTLIELLAVIVILGIIAAIAIPSISKVISNTKNNAKVAEAIQIIDAARIAYTDGTGTTTDNGATYTWSGTSADTDAIDKYLSKVQDTTFTVTYTVATNSYTITGHDSAKVLYPNEETPDTKVLTETELATYAKK